MDELSRPSLPDSGATIALAKRLDFALGAALVRPSLRSIEGPLGAAKGEPRVMQVLVALVDAKGKVLSREDLLRLCWDSRIVGDDAINRAVSEVRRMAAIVGAGFEIETVPRVGYRLTGIDWEAYAEQVPPATGTSGIDRRKALVGGTTALALLAGGSAALVYWQRNAEVDALIERGRVIQGSGGPDDERRAEALFLQAIARDSGRADAWGWLAVVLDDQAKAREAAQHAIALDPREPNARSVLAFQRRDLDAWTQWEEALLGILDDAPDCAQALAHLTFFYQGMGRCKDSWVTNEKAIHEEPFNPGHLHKRAIKHWIFGRLDQADKVADQAMKLWPRHGGAWNARMLIFAFTDRARAALALLDDVDNRPVRLTAPSVESWHAGLLAIASRSATDIARAVKVCTDQSGYAPGLAANAIMFFSHLGELDAAYRVAAGLLEGRGHLVQQSPRGSIRDIYSASNWGRTQFLFIPATAPFRADPRFPDLCRRMGHVAYWQKRGIWPDPFVRGALDKAILA